MPSETAVPPTTNPVVSERHSASAMSPAASVIIPVFNDPGGVAACLQALATQRYPLDRVEVIVVDNGSTPPLTLAGTFPFELRVLQCATPGSYAARNVGAEAATGEVLAFTDADCRADADWLRCGIQRLLAEGGETVIGGEVSISKPEKPTAVALYQHASGFGQKANVCERGFSATANLFCRRTQFAAVGPFDERLLSGGDREWCWRAVSRGFNIRYEPKAAVRTQPRTNLRGAIRQARRVAAGRAQLHKLGLARVGTSGVAKQRSAWQAVGWILSNRNLSWVERVRVLGAAILIRGATAVERWRLASGGKAERR